MYNAAQSNALYTKVKGNLGMDAGGGGIGQTRLYFICMKGFFL
jgi:hypothetical protein